MKRDRALNAAARFLRIFRPKRCLAPMREGAPMSDGSIAISPPSIVANDRGKGFVRRHRWPTINHEPSSLRRTLLSGFAALAARAVIGVNNNQVMAAVEQTALKRRGVGLVASDPERAFPQFTLFAPLFVETETCIS